MPSKYTCHVEGCDFVQELFWADGEGVREILDHEEDHRKNTVEVEKTDRNDCTHCDGKGYIEYTYTVDEDVSKTD